VRILSVLSVFVLAFCFLDFAGAQENKEREIRGILVDPAGKPIAGAKVYTYIEVNPKEAKEAWELTQHHFMPRVGYVNNITVRVLSKGTTDDNGRFVTQVKAKYCKIRFVPIKASLNRHGIDQKTAASGQLLHLEKDLDLGTLVLQYQGTGPDIRVVTEPQNVLRGMYDLRVLYLRQGQIRPVEVLAGFQGELFSKENKLIMGRSTFSIICSEVQKDDRLLVSALQAFPVKGRKEHFGGLQVSSPKIDNDPKLKNSSDDLNINVSGKLRKLTFSLQNQSGKSQKQKNVLVLASPKESRTAATLPNDEQISFVFPVWSARTNDQGEASMELPYGNWYISAIVDGVRYTPLGNSAKSLLIKNNRPQAVSLKARAAPVTNSVTIELNAGYLGFSLDSLAKHHRATYKETPFLLGVYLIPKTTSDNGQKQFFSPAFFPNAVVDVSKKKTAILSNVPTGDYLVFVVGVAKTKPLNKEFSYWVAMPELFPVTKPKRITIKDTTTLIKIDGDTSKEEQSQWYSKMTGIPKSVIERQLTFQATKIKSSNK
jgi:hypothetical protein